MSQLVDFGQALDQARDAARAFGRHGFSLVTFETLPGGRAMRLNLRRFFENEPSCSITVPLDLSPAEFMRVVEVKLKFLRAELG
jgi:hypothetical protein